MREKDIEEYLRDQVKVVGGWAPKWTSPGNAGVPDRIVLFPGGRIAFVELKAPGKRSTVLQEAQQAKIEKLGFDVWVVDSKEKVDAFIWIGVVPRTEVKQE